MTFKDQIKAAETKAAENTGDTSTAMSDNDDIARLLRALNEDLKADPQSTGIDPLDEDDDDEEVAAARRFPLGKIVLALVAAGGVGIAVVMFDGSTPDTAMPVQTAALAPAGQGGTSASPPPQVQPAKPAGPAQPEALIARAPTPGPAPTPAAAPVPAAAAPVPPIPAPPGRVEPAPVPPPVLPGAPSGTQTVVKPIEPPVLPKMDAPKPVQAKAPEVKPAEVKPVEPKAPEILKAPEPKAEPKPAEVKAVEAKAPEVKVAEAKPAEPKAPEILKAPEPKAPDANTAELQAMLSPPKGSQPAGKTLKVKPPAAHAEPATAAPAAPRPAVSATGRWVVQAGSFSVAENAEVVQRKLAAKGYTAQVIDWTDASQRSWKVVRVGGYDNQADARRVAGELKSSLGLSALVVSGR